MKLIAVYQRRSIRNSGGGGRSEKFQHKCFHRRLAAELENDRRENVRELAQALDVSANTVYAALLRTAKLSKKSAGRVKKRFFLEIKKEQFRTYEAAEAMAAAIRCQSETTFSLFERRPRGEERAGHLHSHSEGLL
jgi:hypothetical protein